MAKIMLVEDDNNLREIYEARLIAEGHEIISAHDGEEALAMAVKEKPELIISDVMMPKISGFDMLDILRSSPETKNTKVIMMTALSQMEDKDRADRLGADRYLVKSQVTLEDVIRVAKEVLEGMDSSNDNQQPADVAPIAPSGATPPAEPNTPTEPAVTPQPVADAPVEPVPQPAANMPVAEPPSDTPAGDNSGVVPDDSASTDDASADNSTTTTETPSEEPTTTPAQPAQATPDAPAVSPEATEAVEDAQTTDSELKAVEEQIGQFVDSQPSATPAEAEVPATAAEAPAESSAPTETTPTSIPVTDASAESAPGPAGESPEHAKKVIQPISDPTTQPDINDLLKKEEENEQMAAILNNAGTGPASPAPPTETVTPAPPAETPAQESSDKPEEGGDQPQDPNMIAL